MRESRSRKNSVQTSLVKRKSRYPASPVERSDVPTTSPKKNQNQPTSNQSARSISASDLCSIVIGLDALPPLYRQVHGTSTNGKWYRNERQHLKAWLSEYDGPGAYGRKHPGRDAKFFYNHFNDPYGLSWLAEALGVDEELVQRGMEAIEAASSRGSAKSGAFRKVVPWSMLEPLVLDRLPR